MKGIRYRVSNNKKWYKNGIDLTGQHILEIQQLKAHTGCPPTKKGYKYGRERGQSIPCISAAIKAHLSLHECNIKLRINFGCYKQCKDISRTICDAIKENESELERNKNSVLFCIVCPNSTAISY